MFTHLYPSELVTAGEEFTQLIHEFQVELVKIGHTHYNELANDGQTIYAMTRSTGQSEEGPPGFSFTTIDEDVISWKFKEPGAWPFAMITSPADENLITRPKSVSHLARGIVPIRAKVWGATAPEGVTCSINEGREHPMEYVGGRWVHGWSSC